MSKRWQGEERRDHPRVPVVVGRGVAPAPLPTAIVDLSLSGALLEVPSGLTVDSRYVLHVPLAVGGTLELAGEVVRSYVHGFDKVSAGVPSVRYRAAIKFVDLDPAQLQALEKIVSDSGGFDKNAELSS